jgi:hypothetical protein
MTSLGGAAGKEIDKEVQRRKMHRHKLDLCIIISEILISFDFCFPAQSRENYRHYDYNYLN